MCNPCWTCLHRSSQTSPVYKAESKSLFQEIDAVNDTELSRDWLLNQSDWSLQSNFLCSKNMRTITFCFFFLPAEATRQSTERKPFCNLEWCKMSLLGCNNHGQSSSHNIINYVLIMGMWKMTSSLKVQFRSSAYKIKGRMLYVAEKVNHLSTSTSTHSS